MAAAASLEAAVRRAMISKALMLAAALVAAGAVTAAAQDRLPDGVDQLMTCRHVYAMRSEAATEAGDEAAGTVVVVFPGFLLGNFLGFHVDAYHCCHTTVSPIKHVPGIQGWPPAGTSPRRANDLLAPEKGYRGACIDVKYYLAMQS